jgi:hypothetical protein
LFARLQAKDRFEDAHGANDLNFHGGEAPGAA